MAKVTGAGPGAGASLGKAVGRIEIYADNLQIVQKQVNDFSSNVSNSFKQLNQNITKNTANIGHRINATFNQLNQSANVINNNMNKAAQATQNAGQAAQNASSGVNTLTNSFNRALRILSRVTIAYVSIRTLVTTISRSFDVVELAGKTDRVAVSFAHLSGGAQAAAINLDIIRRASRGTLSDFDAMQVGTQAMAVGLATTSEQLDRVIKSARAVTFVSPVIRDMSDAISQLTLTVANMSFRRLDQLGLSVTEVKDRMVELRRVYPELDDQELLREAVLERINEKYGELLEKTSAIDTIERTSAAWRNLREEIGRFIYPAVLPFLENLTVGFRNFNDAIKYVSDMLKNMKISIGSMDLAYLKFIGNFLWFFIPGVAAYQIGSSATRSFARGAGAGEGAPTDFFSVLVRLPDYINLYRMRLTRGFNEMLGRSVDESLNFSIQQLQARVSGITLPVPIMQPPRLGPSQTGGIFYNEERIQAIMEYFDKVEEIERESNNRRLKAEVEYRRMLEEKIKDYNTQLAREEEDFARQRARAWDEYYLDLADMAEDYAMRRRQADEELSERIQEIREDTNDKLLELERKYQRDLEELNADHRDNMLKAAARLDALGILEEKRSYNKRLKELQDRLEEGRKKELEDRDKRIDDARKSADKQRREEEEQYRLRLERMQRDFQRRLQLEDEDRALRLQRMREDHEAQLAEMKRAFNDRMFLINEQEQQEKKLLEDAFIEQLNELGLFHSNWYELQKKHQENTLKLFEQWWEEIGKRFEREFKAQEALNRAYSRQGMNQYGPREAFPGFYSPAVPSAYADGGYVQKTGMALVHAGEFVLSRSMLEGLGSRTYNNRVSSVNIMPGAIQIYGGSEDVAYAVRRELVNIFNSI